LILDPPIGLLQPYLKGNLRNPSETFNDQRIITVGVSSQLHLGDCFDEVYQLVAAKVDRLRLVAIRNASGARDTVVDILNPLPLVMRTFPDFSCRSAGAAKRCFLT
jgi:hypothetical protein